MRILHFADLHLGVENYGRLDAPTGLHSRLLDFLRSFDSIVDHAVTRQVDLVLFCGDAFRSREPSPTLQCLLAERLRRLSRARIPVVLLAGNHDLPPLPGRRSALDLYPTLDIPGIQVAMTPGLRRIATRSGPVQVVCLPAGGDVRQAQQGDTDSPEDQARGLLDALAARVTPDCPAVLAGHIAVEGARVGSEGRIAVGREIILPRSALTHPAFAYVALGHVHRFQDLNPGQQPPVVYSGSPERVDFSEEEEPKGFVVVEIAPNPERHGAAPPTFSARYDFVETPARRFVTVDVHLEAGDGTPEVLDAIAEHEIGDAVVKVVVHSQEEVAVDDREVRRALGDAQFAAPVAREVETPPARLRAPELAGGWMDPLIALDEYLKTTRLSDDRKQQLRDAARRLLTAELHGSAPHHN